MVLVWCDAWYGVVLCVVRRGVWLGVMYAWCGVWCGMVWCMRGVVHSMAWWCVMLRMVWYGVWCGVVWCGVMWCNVWCKH